MPFASEHDDPLGLPARVRDAGALTAELFSDVIKTVCRRFPSLGQPEKTARIEHLIASSAWTDAMLTLINLELPQWQVRRIAYDEGEWHCALSRQRELPEWLDQSIEARHVDLSLAILTAFVDAQRPNGPPTTSSVPPVPRPPDALYEPACCDNFA